MWPCAQFPVSFWNRQAFFKHLTPLWGPVLCWQETEIRKLSVILCMGKGQVAGDHTIWKRCRYKQAPTRVHSVSNTPTYTFTHTPYNHPSLCYLLESIWKVYVSVWQKECAGALWVAWVGPHQISNSAIVTMVNVNTRVQTQHGHIQKHACTHIHTHIFDAELLQSDEWMV